MTAQKLALKRAKSTALNQHAIWYKNPIIIDMRILHIDSNHSLLRNQLNELGCINDEDYTSSKAEILTKIHHYDGCIIRSRFSIDKEFLDKATKLKFIGRVGAGLENIDCDYAEKKGIYLIAAPEGNRNAVGEHALGMLLSLFNNLNTADREVRNGHWLREENRGIEAVSYTHLTLPTKRIV